MIYSFYVVFAIQLSVWVANTELKEGIKEIYWGVISLLSLLVLIIGFVTVR